MEKTLPLLDSNVCAGKREMRPAKSNTQHTGWRGSKRPFTGRGKNPLDFMVTLGSCLEIIGSLKMMGLSGVDERKGLQASVPARLWLIPPKIEDKPVFRKFSS